MKNPAEYLSEIKDYFFKDRNLFEFDSVQAEEDKLIKERRKRLNIPEGNPQKDAVGLALSGGGVRSATFNLGLLQAL
ncbi:MAG: hypothetical protein JW956_01340, partial [Calditrichaceae bacterium]|nr:hypothetical protein [Calditrichaceae bacterium]